MVLQGNMECPTVKRMSGKGVKKFQSEAMTRSVTCQVTPISADQNALPDEIL